MQSIHSLQLEFIKDLCPVLNGEIILCRAVFIVGRDFRKESGGATGTGGKGRRHSCGSSPPTVLKKLISSDDSQYI